MKHAARLPVIVDTTLRDGMQMPGAALSFGDKTAVFDRLVRLGITEAEIGVPAQSSGAIDEIRRLHERHPSVDCIAWCRARIDDIEAAARSGVATIHISFPVSERHMAIGRKTPERILAQCAELVACAHAAAPRVTVGAQDATRADRRFLAEFTAAAADAGAARVRIADTVGIATPESISRCIAALKAAIPRAALEFHAHNDFGLATATTLAAIEAGVDAISGTVLGVGERAGNAAIEEVITAAVVLYGYSTDLRLSELAGLGDCTAKRFQLPSIPNKAVCGINAFRHESGIHCHGMLRDTLAYQPYAPSLIGRKELYSLGPQSGRSSLQAVLQQQGTSADPSDLRDLRKRRT